MSTAEMARGGDARRGRQLRTAATIAFQLRSVAITSTPRTTGARVPRTRATAARSA